METKTASKSEGHRRGVPENQAAGRYHASNRNKKPSTTMAHSASMLQVTASANLLGSNAQFCKRLGR